MESESVWEGSSKLKINQCPRCHLTASFTKTSKIFHHELGKTLKGRSGRNCANKWHVRIHLLRQLNLKVDSITEKLLRMKEFSYFLWFDKRDWDKISRYSLSAAATKINDT